MIRPPSAILLGLVLAPSPAHGLSSSFTFSARGISSDLEIEPRHSVLHQAIEVISTVDTPNFEMVTEGTWFLAGFPIPLIGSRITFR